MIRMVRTVCGKARVIDGVFGHRAYVKKTNVRTWVVSSDQTLTLDSMIQVGGDYHFNTLSALKAALVEVTR